MPRAALRPRRRLDSIRRAQRRVGSLSRRRGSRTTAGATSRRRGSRASMAISAGRAPTPRSSSRRPPTTISAWSGRRRSSCSTTTTGRSSPGRRLQRTLRRLLALNGRYDVTDHWTVQSNLYYRRFHQEHVDGNSAEVERCSGAAANPLFNTLCLEDDGFPRQPAANFQLITQNNQPINCPQGPAIPARACRGARSTAPSPTR